MTQKGLNEPYGNFETVRVIGEGGMGTVFEACNIHMPEMRRAIKVIRPDYAQEPAFRDFFKREAKIMVELNNYPGIVRILSYGIDGGHNRDRLYIAMEFIEGENLGERLRNLKPTKNWLGLEEAIWLIRQLCPALQKVHAKNIWHRDLKPDNIMLDRDPEQEFGYRPVLMDFGIAELKEVAEGTARLRGGTPLYMSPEQADCNKWGVDGRSDIYSLGVILFELVTRKLPLYIKTTADIDKICRDEPLRPTSIYPDLPLPLEAIILKSLAKDPADRFQTVTEMCEALNELDLQKTLRPQTVSAKTTILLIEAQDPSTSQERIKNPNDLPLPKEVKTVLEKMFPEEQYQKVTLWRQFNKGLSGAYVYEVGPRNTKDIDEAHSVIKIAARSLILKEYEACKQYIQKAEIENKIVLKWIKSIGEPIDLKKLGWAGLRYAMVDNGNSEVMGLHDYYKEVQTGLDKQQELLSQMSQIWALGGGVSEKNYSVRKHFSHLLPPDLVINYPSSTSSPNQSPLEFGAKRPLHEFKKGDFVKIVGNQFILVKVDPDKKTIVLRSPPEDDRSYNVRVSFQSNPQAMESFFHYSLGDLVLQPILGTVDTTRADSFHKILTDTLGAIKWQKDVYFNLRVLEKLLPNPWLALELALNQFLDGTRDGVIHGDLNLENVLLEDPGYALYLIDFAHMRQDKVLHDFWTYETRIITKIVAELCRDEGGRLPKIIYDFYCQLDQETFKQNKAPISAKIPEKLEKPFNLLVELRQNAIHHITDHPKRYQYYLGLTVYLLGAMKYGDLDELTDAQGRSIPKQLAFWGAATVVQWAELDLPSQKDVITVVTPPPAASSATNTSEQADEEILSLPPVNSEERNASPDSKVKLPKSDRGNDGSLYNLPFILSTLVIAFLFLLALYFFLFNSPWWWLWFLGGLLGLAMVILYAYLKNSNH